MLTWPPTVRIYLCTGSTDMRKGFDSLASLVESTLALDPLSGHLFVFRSRRGERKFFEARTSAPVLAHAALARIRQLYKVEAAAETLSAEDRRALRQRESVPLLTRFGEWLIEPGRHALPKSPIGQAVSYARSNERAHRRLIPIAPLLRGFRRPVARATPGRNRLAHRVLKRHALFLSPILRADRI